MADEINIGIADVATAQLIECVPEPVVIEAEIVEIVPCQDAPEQNG